MSGQQDSGATREDGQGAATPQQIDAALQEAMRRQAATRTDLPGEDQVFDSGNQGGMGAQGSGHGRGSGRHS